MQETEQPAFMETVKEIRGAEEEYDRIISAAKEKADRILHKAKETVLEERAKREEEIVAFKNKKLQDGSKEIENAVKDMLDKARDEAAKISDKKLDKTAVGKLAKDFLGSL